MSLSARAPATKADSAAPDDPSVALTDIVLRTFELNGLFLSASERLAKPAGLTPARWQILGAVLAEPLTVSAIARGMGLARQSVQRIADALVEDGLARTLDNPAHRRARLLEPTEEGWARIAVLHETQPLWTRRVAEGIDGEQLRGALAVMDRIAEGVARVAREDGAPLPEGGGLREGGDSRAGARS